MAPTFNFAPGTIVVDDRAYNDYALFGRWTVRGLFRHPHEGQCIVYVVQERKVPQHRQVLKNQLIQLTGLRAQERCPHLLRRIEVFLPDTGEILVFLTNHQELGASTIAAIYKDRWQIEIFFKALKQNLKIKTLWGPAPMRSRSRSGPQLIAMLILRFLQLRSQFGWSLSNLGGPVADESVHPSRSLDLAEPSFETAPIPYEPEQLHMTWA